MYISTQKDPDKSSSADAFYSFSFLVEDDTGVAEDITDYWIYPESGYCLVKGSKNPSGDLELTDEMYEIENDPYIFWGNWDCFISVLIHQQFPLLFS